VLIDLTPPQIQTLMIALAALSTVGVILAVAWPWIARDRMAERVQMVEKDLRQLRRNERSRSAAASVGRSSLFAKEPNRVFAEIVERLSLARLTDESSAAQLLKMAGLRGRAPLIAFLASRLIAAMVMPGFAFAYLALVLKSDLSLLQIVAIVVVGAGIGYTLPKLYVRNLISKRHTSLRRSWPDAPFERWPKRSVRNPRNWPRRCR